MWGSFKATLTHPLATLVLIFVLFVLSGFNAGRVDTLSETVEKELSALKVKNLSSERKVAHLSDSLWNHKVRTSEKLSVIEESIDPQKTRWVKIKKVRKTVQETIDRHGYKNVPNVIGLTTYAASVVDYSERYDVPIALILAVTKRESAFNPRAVSHANAKGLMQIIPTTAQEIAGDVGVRHYSLFKIRDNVQFGTWYLRKMMDYFDGDVSLAVRAYNCGPTCVNRILAGEWSKFKCVWSDNSMTYEDYPCETTKYEEMVMRWMKEYEIQGF
jgi:soluble lytic murein transglycosylase